MVYPTFIQYQFIFSLSNLMLQVSVAIWCIDTIHGHKNVTGDSLIQNKLINSTSLDTVLIISSKAQALILAVR